MPKVIPHKDRIQLGHSSLDTLHELSEGNPGALTVCMQLLQSKHDPDNFLGGLGNLLSMDTNGVYGSNIWILFKDCCGQQILNMVTVFRAVQLGIISEKEMWDHIDNSLKFDIVRLYNEVKLKLPNFNPAGHLPCI